MAVLQENPVKLLSDCVSSGFFCRWGWSTYLLSLDGGGS